MIGVVLSLLLTAAPVVLLVLLVRRMTRPGGGAVDGRSVRRFFQYAVLYGLVLVAGSGVTGLLARAVGPPTMAVGDDAELARALTFTLVGLPLLVAVVLWTRRVHRRESEERTAAGWAVYTTVAALTALVMTMAELHAVVSDAVEGRWAASSAVALLVWGGLWVLHVRLVRRTVPAPSARPHLAAGSLVGLGTLLVGLTAVIADAGRVLVLERGVDRLVSTTDGGALALAVTGALVWSWYWLGAYRRGRPDGLWLVYVLPIGVGASLVMAVVGAGLASYSTLVWFLGDPAGTAVEHFAGTPAAVGAAFVGGVSWWYHRQVLRGAMEHERSEVDRAHDYLMTGIALLAAGAGVAVLVAAAIEVLLPPAVAERGASLANSLLAAVTLLVVGGPLWWAFWRGVRHATARATAAEVGSPVRRVYLLILFGLGAVAAVVTVLVASYTAISAVLDTGFEAATVGEMRIPLGILVATAAISGYHWRVYRDDRRSAPRAGAAGPTGRRGPHYVLLIGAPDDGVVAAVRRATRGEVHLWVRTDAPATPWVADEVVAAVTADPHPALAVIGDADGLRSIPIARA
nr:DUF5671 domain-containing protein [uncultured Actinotalea sp.]